MTRPLLAALILAGCSGPGAQQFDLYAEPSIGRTEQASAPPPDAGTWTSSAPPAPAPTSQSGAPGSGGSAPAREFRERISGECSVPIHLKGECACPTPDGPRTAVCVDYCTRDDQGRTVAHAFCVPGGLDADEPY